jgi:hypothetical protein
MPEWYLVVALLGALSLAGIEWRPLLACLPFFGVAVGALVAHAAAGASHASFKGGRLSPMELARMRLLTALLFLAQPLARLRGRLGHGLSPWRVRVQRGFCAPLRRTHTLWSERWRAPDERLRELERTLRNEGATVLRGNNFDDWDLEIRAGAFGSARLRMLCEEHGAGRQLVRFGVCPRWSQFGLGLLGVVAVLAGASAIAGAWPAAALLAGCVVALGLRSLREWGGATAQVMAAIGDRDAAIVRVEPTLDTVSASRV